MSIDPFLAGVLSTVFVEMAVIIFYSVYRTLKK